MLPQPIAPYPAQKLAGEIYMQSYARVYGMANVSLRYFNIFGPRQAPDSPYSGVIAKWSLAMLRPTADNAPVIQGRTANRGGDFTYVANAVEANLAGAGSSGRKDRPGACSRGVWRAPHVERCLHDSFAVDGIRAEGNLRGAARGRHSELAGERERGACSVWL